ncbi:MAG: hypothetical protein OXH24_03310 [Cyanobacteria bacterium MAG IRC3_bin_20]|nr:hypothetical protein [Cyanobacteria bacterium MAG IRC3_bin_20]
MTLPEGKRLAYQRRQKDTGWGRAIAHPIIGSFYALYYAISRRTITPLLYGLAARIAAIIIPMPLMIFLTEQEVASLEPLVYVYFFAVELIVTKLGIDRARESARVALKNENQSPAD